MAPVSPFDAPRGVAILIRAKNTRAQVWIRRSDNGLWAMPAGRIEPGEHPIEAACRETFEETGLTIDRPLCLGVATSGRWQIALYRVVVPTELPLVSSFEGEVEWRINVPRDAVQAYPGYTAWALWRERIAT